MKNPLIWVVVVIVLAAFGWWLYSSMYTPPQGQVSGAQDEQFIDDSKDGGVAGAGASAGAQTITYTDAGFSPQTLTVKKGTSVTFVNQSSHEMWIASDEHPTHTSYDGSSKDTHCAAGYTGAAPLDACGTVSSFTFTFSASGSWGYHNHREDDDHGVVVVTQ